MFVNDVEDLTVDEMFTYTENGDFVLVWYDMGYGKEMFTHGNWRENQDFICDRIPSVLYFARYINLFNSYREPCYIDII